ncbi:ISL3 family transposase [Actinomycetota bacterium]
MVQRTHARTWGGQRQATLLLGIEGLAVASVTLEDDGGRVVDVVTDEETAAACPECGVLSTSRKGGAVTRPRDVPYGTAPIRLVWHKTRWRCREPRCPRGSFTECLASVPARSRLTTRLRAECGERIATDASCVQAAADRYRVSWPIAHAAFIGHVEAQLAAPLPPVEVLGIDETRRGKPIWTQDPVTCRWRIVTDRWLTGIVDAAGTGGLLGHVDGRTAATVADWLREQPEAWRAGVTHVCIDLSASYAKAVTDALPDATLVADRFHLVRLSNDMVTALRQRVTREDRGRRGRKRDPEWASRRRLLTAHERLSPGVFARLWNGLIDQGDLGVEILHAYVVKESLRELLALAPTPATSVPDRSAISHRLWRFLDLAAASDSPEVHRLAATIDTWWPAIEAGLLTGHSNARSEGYNRLAKHQGRNAFGFRNTENQRRRIRWACTRQHRRASATTSEVPGQVR